MIVSLRDVKSVEKNGCLKIQVKGRTKSTIKFTHVNHYLINASAKLSYLKEAFVSKKRRGKNQHKIFERKSHQQIQIKKNLSQYKKPSFFSTRRRKFCACINQVEKFAECRRARNRSCNQKTFPYE